MSEQLTIRTLGGLAIEHNSVPVSGFDSRKVQALLVFLACTGRVYPREVVAEMLWEERTQAQALSNLRVALTSLRQTVQPFVTITRESVGLDPESDVWLDAAAFERQLDAAGTDAVRLAAALELYAGDFLAGFYVDSTAFEEWSTRERERLRLSAMEGLDRLTACYATQGDYRVGIAAAARLLDMDPLREETHRRLMELLWWSEQRGKALEQYETCRRLLRDELGIDPSPDTTALYERIRTGETPIKAAEPQAIRSYLVRERIGAGGFGEVYRAFQPVVNREVAIKIIKPELANQSDFIRRFETEAQLVAQLEHPHIVPLYDYWREPGGAYLVMRYLPRSLEDRLAHGPLTLDESVRLVEQIAAALTVAHRQGIVHRDLKPENILLDDEDNAYLTDFGIAKVLGPAARATVEGGVIGSPAYLAPEQIKSEPVTPSSDLYSLGLLLYEALTGSLPFSADLSPSALLYRQLSEPLPSLLTSRPDLPPALDDVLQRATAKDPADRFTDALSLAAAFRQASAATIAAHDQRRRWTPADALVTVRNPYKGLRAFTEADTDDFFGREALVEQLLARLDEKGPFERFLAVIGPSGCGKSSVVRAGVIPAVREGRLPGSEAWFIAEMLPGAHPLEELEIALTHIAARTPPHIMEQLQRDDRGVLRAVRMTLPHETSQLLLVIDQFEEVFTLVDDPAETRHFLNSLYTAVTDPRSPLRVIVTLRADFYDRPLMHAEVSQLVRHRTEIVVPMTAEEIERAISTPAEQVGVSLEPGLAVAITAEVHEQPGALPMLQYALTQIFDRRQDNTLTLDIYRMLGGVMGVLAEQADTVYQQFDDSQQELARQLFLRLVTLGEGIEDTRRRVRRTELISLGGPAMEPIIDAFDRSRLFTLDQDPVNREPTVEIAHEALLREWRLLRQWLDQSRDDIRVQRRLAHAAQEWLNADRDPSYLATGTRLSLFETWAAATDVALTDQEARYLEASIAEWRARREREARLERRARQWLMALVVGLAVFLVVALGLLIFAIREQDKAKDQARAARAAEANAERNAAEIQSLLWANNARQALDHDDLDLALPLALAANRIDNPPVFDQRTLAEIAYAPGLQRRLAGHTSQITSVAYSPDGRFALSGAYDNRLILWDLDSGTVLREFYGLHTAAITSVAFHPDGQRALSGSLDGRLILWDISTGRVLDRLTGHTQAIYSVAFSPDGRWALSGSQDKTAIVWEVDTGAAVQTLSGEADAIHSVAFSPDGRLALTGGWDGQVVLWDVESGLAAQRFEGHTASVYSVAFTPDGRQIISGGGDDQLILWNVVSPRPLAILSGSHAQRFLCIAVSPDGRWLLTGSEDSLVILWSLESREKAITLRGHTGAVTSVAFSPPAGGRPLSALSASRDNNLILWGIASGAILSTWQGHAADVLAVAYSPDGQRAATASSDRTVVIRDVRTGTRLLTLRGHTDRVQSVAFSPDGRLVASASRDGTIRLWDAETGQERQQLRGHESYVNSVAFSPDGRALISGSHDQDVIIWDLETGAIRHRLEANQGPVYSVAFSPDGWRALSGSRENALILWDVDTGARLSTLRGGHTSYVSAVAFSPDGQTILSGSGDNTIILWDAQTGAVRRSLSGHTDDVTSVAFHPDGQVVLSGSRDGTLILWAPWDREREAVLNVLAGHTGPITNVAFSPDGRTALSGSSDKTAIWWRIDATPDELVAWALTHREVRELTCTERDTFLVPPLCDNNLTYPTRTPHPAMTSVFIPHPVAGTVQVTVAPDQALTSTPAPPLPTPTAEQPSATPAPTRQPASPVPTAVPAFSGALLMGVSVSGMTRPGDRLQWTFDGVKGQAITLVNNSFNVAFMVLDTDGTVLAGPSSEGRIGPVVLPFTGTYSVLAIADLPGRYLFTLVDESGP